MNIFSTIVNSKKLFFVTLVVLFISLMILNNTLLRNMRVDLTENQLYTLSDGTLNLLENIQEPLDFYLFFSEETAQDYPQIKNHYLRVKEMLEEYRLYSNQALRVHYINPEPFSEEEDRATQLGIQPVQAANGSLYFGLAGTNSVDDSDVIPFFQVEKEVLLEYELGQLIYSLMRIKKPVLGLMSTLNMYPSQLNAQTGQLNQTWVIADELEKLFDVRLVQTDVVEIPDNIDVLMVVHPKDTRSRSIYLPDTTLYAIDQFIMRKGRGMFFVDPFSTSEFLPVPQDQPLQEANAKSSSLNPLFRKWGFEVSERTVIGDRQLALPTRNQQGQSVRNITVLGINQKFFDTKDPVMTGLQTLNFAIASHITAKSDDPAVSVIPLVQTSKASMPIDLNRLRFLADPSMLLQGFRPTDEQYTVAARIRGPLKSAYDKPPQPEGAQGEKAKVASQYKHVHVAETNEPAELVVVADTDMLSDQLWVQAQSFFGQRLVRPFASNGDFVGNVIENLMGSNDLMGIRNRASYSRPFILIDEIEHAADRKYRETAEQLQRELSQIDQRLQQLQQKRNDQGDAILTREQLDELNKAKAKRIAVRKKLRNVRHQQNKDIENIGTRIKIINIGVVPALVGILALIVGLIRVRSRKRETI